MLDLGCGSGPHIQLLSPRCKKITGIDYSWQMLDLARMTLAHTAKKNWRLVHADASHIPFGKGTFDCIIAMGLLDYVPSPLEVLKECRRVIASKGMCIITIPKKPSLFSFLRNPIGEWVKRVIFHLPPIDNALTRGELETLLQNAGFQILAVKSVWGTMWMIKMHPYDDLKNRANA
jgi:ubiquinone/menaquinone biosynthesis C-methylase UbiE